MPNLMFRIVTLAAFLMALNAPASFTPAFGTGGGGGGGGGGDTTSDPREQRSLIANATPKDNAELLVALKD